MSLRDAWEAEAERWIAWARRPGHDSYWKFHRDAFLPSLPPPPRRVVDVGCDRVAELEDSSDPPGSPWWRLPLFLHLGAVKP